LSIIAKDSRMNLYDDQVKLKYKDKLQTLKLAHNSVQNYQSKLSREFEKYENENQTIEEENESNGSCKSKHSFNSDKSLDVDDILNQYEENKKNLIHDKNGNKIDNNNYKTKSTLSNTNSIDLRNKYKVNINKNNKTTD
jgi:hypothetical protein